MATEDTVKSLPWIVDKKWPQDGTEFLAWVVTTRGKKRKGWPIVLEHHKGTTYPRDWNGETWERWQILAWCPITPPITLEEGRDEAI